MEIKVKKQSENPLNDILDTILNLNDTDFKNATRTIDYEFDEGLSFYYDDKIIDIPLSIVFDFFSKSISNYDEHSIQRERIEEILVSRGEEKAYDVIIEKSEGIDEFEFLFVKKVFEILKDDELFEKFKQFDENKEIFGLPNALAKKSQDIQNYLRIMISIFGNINKEGQLVNTSPVLDDFYIPKIEEYKRRFIEIYKTYEPLAKKETKKLKYKFDFRKVDDTIVSVLDKEPEWQLNDKIRAEILKEMPVEMSPEEKAIHIYTKMCHLFAYDEGYVYREQEQGNRINYTPQFSKEHLESLTPNSKITCFDFSRIYKKIIDSLDEPMEAEILTQGLNNGHFYIGFATENCQATLEAINITDKDRNSSE